MTYKITRLVGIPSLITAAVYLTYAEYLQESSVLTCIILGYIFLGSLLATFCIDAVMNTPEAQTTQHNDFFRCSRYPKRLSDGRYDLIPKEGEKEVEP